MSQTGRWVEVQIRSSRMDDIAERGYAAHWKYKDMIDTETGLEEWLNKIRDMLIVEDTNALDFVDDFRLNLFADEIYTYTPVGDVKNAACRLDSAGFCLCHPFGDRKPLHWRKGQPGAGIPQEHAEKW